MTINMQVKLTSASPETKGVLPPLRYTKEGNPVFFLPSMNPERRAKLKTQWSKMDDEDCQPHHYKHYEWNLRSAVEQLEIREDQLRASLGENMRMREALIRSERKLSAYVGVCKGDKELTDTVLPMARAVLSDISVEGQ